MAPSWSFAANAETPFGFYACHQITALVPVNDFARAPGIKAWQAKQSKVADPIQIAPNSPGKDASPARRSCKPKANGGSP
jgi:hypothetical protein